MEKIHVTNYFFFFIILFQSLKFLCTATRSAVPKPHTQAGGEIICKSCRNAGEVGVRVMIVAAMLLLPFRVLYLRIYTLHYIQCSQLVQYVMYI